MCDTVGAHHSVRSPSRPGLLLFDFHIGRSIGEAAFGAAERTDVMAVVREARHERDRETVRRASGADDGGAVVVVGERIVRLTRDELERLLAALAGFGRPAADAVREQIGALRLAGGTIRLLPSEAERALLDEAIAGLR